MRQAFIIVIGVVALIGGWFFISPLFIDRVVDESFDLLEDNGQLDMDAIMAMPDEARLAMMDEIMAHSAQAADRTAADTMPAGAPEAIARGTFVDADLVHKGSGIATLYRLPDDSHVVRFEDFRTTNGPALVVYLARHPDPASAADVTEPGFISIGKLKGNVGSQNYVLPSTVDVSDYNSVVIWCELFGVLFSPAALTRL